MNNYIYNEVNMTETFRNPITESGADPFVVRFEDGYYYVYSADGGVFVSRADNIHHLRQDGKCIFRPEEGKPYSRELWAPEIHFIDGDWYCYVAADDGVNANHHMYVLKSTDGRPDGVYAMVGMLDDGSGCWAIDGTVMPCGGKLYFVWSGWESRENTHQNLYIAPMKSPTELAGARVLISRPEYDWEKRGSGPTKSGKCLPTVNEGPQILELVPPLLPRHADSARRRPAESGRLGEVQGARLCRERGHARPRSLLLCQGKGRQNRLHHLPCPPRCQGRLGRPRHARAALHMGR